ncbi:MAG: hypothetical protein ILO53_00195 [Clostridia bacterium]|nr:hypothetical protein [Clostridia bacterium]
MENINDINLLLDFYGALLGEKQRGICEMYYGLDMTLAEIAEETGISRQAASQSIAKSVKQLRGYDERLGLMKRFQAAREIVGDMDRDVRIIPGDALPREAGEILDDIKKKLAMLCEVL